MKTENLAKALANFQKERPEIKLDATVTVRTKSGASYNFKYATLSNIMKNALPVLAQNGLAISQVFSGEKLMTYLLHESGERLVSIVPVNLKTGTMQEKGSRISYLKRYAIAAMLGIVADEDDDANIADDNSFEKSKNKGVNGGTSASESPKKSKDDNSITDTHRKKLFALMKNAGLTRDEAKDLYDYVNPETKQEALKFIDKFNDYLTLWREVNSQEDEDF